MIHFTKELPRHYLRMSKTAAERHHSQSLQCHGLLLIFSFIISSVNAQSITLVKDTVLPLKGSSFGMACILSVPFTSNGITLLRNGNSQVSCNPRVCVYGNWYTSKVNQTGVFITISSLDSGSHEGSWTCTYAVPDQENIISNPVNLYVYTLPTGIHVIQEPSENVDLSMTSATFQCRTIGCSYPDPVIQWTYENQDITTGTQTSTSDSCTSPEKIYTSTLFIHRNSTLSDNSDKTVIFSCRTDYPDPSINIRASATKSVRFAVRVTEVVLQQNNKNITDLLTVNLGKPVALTCMTGLSRPDPTVDWYIGLQKRGNGSSLNFTPSNADHTQIIYCQAYNTDPNMIVYSLKPRLSVQDQPSLPSVQAFQCNFPWLENQTGTLQCVMSDSGNPRASVIWTSSRGTVDMNSSLVLRNLSADDHGQPVYCQVQNSFTVIKGLAVVSPTITLNVEYRPSITLNPSVQPLKIREGSNLTVTCMASGNPQPIVQWKNKNPPSNTLHIPGILRNSTGSYTCMASSSSTNYNHVLLQREESTRVIVEFTPEKPINFHVTNVQEKQLSLKWLSGYHWGFGQMFVVEASIDNKTWINVSQVDSGNNDGWFSTTVGNLIPGSEYLFRLYAYNINGRGDFSDVQLEVRTLKESAYSSSMEVSSSVGIGVGGAVGIAIGGAVIGFIGAIITFAFRRRLHRKKSSCFRSKGNTDEEMHAYSNTEMNPETVKPIYEELNKENTEQSVYDKI